ncbi:serpin-ZX-like [Daucus carota subsp. sativus]|uniref:serpin-ZX-like n=1 Tax=Daucus carota subsp. sativus TaxID=79200 RepID=UPI0007EF5139|nr:PREDICTED: serpin-ZX-like [Daucus carota subsp. sativus]
MEQSFRKRQRKSSNPTKFTPIYDVEKIIRNQTDVALVLAKHILRKGSHSNVVFSPISVQLVLALIAAGSEGHTLNYQLLSFLKVDSTQELNALASHVVQNVFEGPASLSLANGVWTDRSVSFKPFFREVADSVYKAVSHVVDFRNRASEATSNVNSWIERETNGLVKGTVPPHKFDEKSKIVFANAIYFKASWAVPFSDWMTDTFDFHLLNDEKVQVSFMSYYMKQAFINVCDGFKVLKLPYHTCQLISMYILLPDAKDGLPSLVDKLATGTGFLEHLDIPDLSEVRGKYRVPKFKVSFGFDATEALKEFGLREPFIPGGLNTMMDSERNELLYVSNILQKSSIQIDEEGTEASPCTSIAMPPPEVPPLSIDFVADHPFLFIIREDSTGVVLFVGQVLNPLAI